MDFLTNKKTGEVFPLDSGGISESDFSNEQSISDVIQESNAVDGIKTILDHIEKQPEEIKNEIDSINILITTNEGEPYAYADSQNGDLGFRIQDERTGKELIPIVDHELNHLKLDKMKIDEPQRYDYFARHALELRPFTINLERIYEQLQESKNIDGGFIGLVQERIQTLEKEYIDEVYSETAENLSLKKNHLEEYNVTNPEELEKAINLYELVNKEKKDE